MPATRFPRRKFLSSPLAATACAVAAPSILGGIKAADRPARAPLPPPREAPFDTIVVLMMENRSFDHLLGWLTGANGRQHGLSYADKDGAVHPTWPLAPDFQGCHYLDPDHTWQGIRDQYAGGSCDGFLKTPSAKPGDLFPIGYYREGDLPILHALAKGYTTFDNYFCSMMGPTWENRLYQLTATTQLIDSCDYPAEDEPRPVEIETAIFDRVREAGLKAGYYHHSAPITKLFASRKYDRISYPIDQFWADARDGRLANVVFIDPDYSDLAEDMGTSNDYHPWGNVLVAEGFVARVHDALKASPQWQRLVFVLNFDEHGGFFDHVPPPICADDTELSGPDLKRLGFRVPAIAMGPFAPMRIESGGFYEHCSILKMIEWRWGLEPLRLRDRRAKNLAAALDFGIRRDPIDLPAFAPPPSTACWEGGGWTELAVSPNGELKATAEVEQEEGAVYRGRLVRRGQELAAAAGHPLADTGRVVVEMKVTKSVLSMIAAKDNRLPALLEVTSRKTGGSICRSTSPVLLYAHPQP